MNALLLAAGMVAIDGPVLGKDGDIDNTHNYWKKAGYQHILEDQYPHYRYCRIATELLVRDATWTGGYIPVPDSKRKRLEILKSLLSIYSSARRCISPKH